MSDGLAWTLFGIATAPIWIPVLTAVVLVVLAKLVRL